MVASKGLCSNFFVLPQFDIMKDFANTKFLEYVQNEVSKPRQIILLGEILREVTPQNDNGKGFFRINGEVIFIPQILRDPELDESLFPFLVDMAKGVKLKAFGAKLTVGDYERFLVYQQFCLNYIR